MSGVSGDVKQCLVVSVVSCPWYSPGCGKTLLAKVWRGGERTMSGDVSSV